MKIVLHIIGAMNRAGAETMIMNLYRELDKNEFQFEFLYFTDKKSDYDDEIEALGGKIHRVSNTSFINRIVETYKFLRTHKYFYAVHSHTLLNNGTNLFAAYLAGHKRRVSHSHNTSNGAQTSFLSIIYYQFSKYLINTFANGFIACGKEAGGYLYYKKNKFLFLPNAINFTDFDISKTNIRTELIVNDETLLICQIGRFLEVKNHVFTIELAKYMLSENYDFHIVFVGEGMLMKEMQEKVKEYELDSKITFLGLRKDIPAILSSTDCMIMPSLHEGFPVVLVEAQVAGIPSLISTDIDTEVDLGVGLIKFQFLSSDYKIWANSLKEIRKNKKEDTLYLEVLRDKGFDVKRSLDKLLEYYDVI